MSKIYYRQKPAQERRIKRMMGIFLVFLGVVILGYFFFPLLVWQVYYSQALASGDVQTPIPRSLVVGSNPDLGGLFAQGIANFTTDFSDARNWYPNLESSINRIDLKSYTLSIPKLSIKNAEVSTIDYDLSRHLVQYAGTAKPGEPGTAVIFGHSSLPQFFSNNNYKTIFATLHTLKVGDTFQVDVNGATYTYKIFTILVTLPEDTTMFTQQFDDSYMTLVTCTPPGTVWKRLVIKAKIQDLATLING